VWFDAGGIPVAGPRSVKAATLPLVTTRCASSDIQGIGSYPSGDTTVAIIFLIDCMAHTSSCVAPHAQVHAGDQRAESTFRTFVSFTSTPRVRIRKP